MLVDPVEAVKSNALDINKALDQLQYECCAGKGNSMKAEEARAQLDIKVPKQILISRVVAEACEYNTPYFKPHFYRDPRERRHKTQAVDKMESVHTLIQTTAKKLKLEPQNLELQAHITELIALFRPLLEVATIPPTENVCGEHHILSSSEAINTQLSNLGKAVTTTDKLAAAKALLAISAAIKDQEKGISSLRLSGPLSAEVNQLAATISQLQPALKKNASMLLNTPGDKKALAEMNKSMESMKAALSRLVRLVGTPTVDSLLAAAADTVSQADRFALVSLRNLKVIDLK